ncbi:MAG: hypothetical protein IPK32_25325 [Verrucomicrobiaceae bacterium]|nr:hypothetical protein [Verrucomicrobiaceae bacterium]
MTDYLTKTGLQLELRQARLPDRRLGCTTCIGNPGPLDAGIGRCRQRPGCRRLRQRLPQLRGPACIGRSR